MCTRGMMPTKKQTWWARSWFKTTGYKIISWTNFLHQQHSEVYECGIVGFFYNWISIHKTHPYKERQCVTINFVVT